MEKPLADVFISVFGEDFAEDESDGFFEHPLSPSPIYVAGASCARFWIEFEHGKWLYPRLRNGSVAALDQNIIDLATEVFGTTFVEACSWD